MGSPYLSAPSGTGYVWVDMGPIPGMPSWHPQSTSSSYPFPTAEAAERFASRHRAMYPGRQITTRPETT